MVKHFSAILHVLSDLVMNDYCTNSWLKIQKLHSNTTRPNKTHLHLIRFNSPLQVLNPLVSFCCRAAGKTLGPRRCRHLRPNRYRRCMSQEELACHSRQYRLTRQQFEVFICLVVTSMAHCGVDEDSLGRLGCYYSTLGVILGSETPGQTRLRATDYSLVC